MPRRKPAPPADQPLRRTSLSRDRVLAEALRLVDTEGLDALTMRRLGRERGRDPMALNRYAPTGQRC